MLTECDKLPEVPVIVAVKLPVGAVLVAARVSTLVPVVLAGEKEALTPLGRPDAVKLTVPLKPNSGVTVIVLEALAACWKLKLAGDAERAKFGGALTVRAIRVVLVRLPDVPEIVRTTDPVVAVLLAVSVNVLVLEVVLGTKAAVTPDGKPETLKLALPEKFPIVEIVIVLVALAP